MDISKIDKNFKVDNTVRRDGWVYYPIDQPPFKIYGLIKEDGIYKRMPQSVADSVNTGVAALTRCSAGGRVRFVTDSKDIAISVKYNEIPTSGNMSLVGFAGLDMYEETDSGVTYVFSAVPPADIKKELNSVKEFSEHKMRRLLINFPTYSSVKEILIGLREGSNVYPPSEYAVSKPVVFYGSSITQGGCASRPGNTYQAILSAQLGFDYINLGFSGNAKGEDAIARYIAALDMSAFVYDYDFNAPDSQHLEATHKRMFDIIRDKNHDLPILILSRPNPHLSAGAIERREITRATYEAAVKAGDKNVYFIPGDELILPMFSETALVDDAHPNDSGFVSMAEVIKPILKKMLDI